MKREIKFRLWDSKNHKWFIKGEDGIVSNMVCSGSWDMFDPDDYVWCQYTGLHDKNGREIYEGDIIVTHPKSRYEAPKSGVVQFGDSCPSFGYKTEDGEEYDIWSSNAYRTYEVIGNIFEDKQLLEEEQ